ncbi:MAG: hypothetical protein IJW20_04705 [Clostridia bacterium]|nr:hypothetical protein [Clostridia bacterium]
MKKILKIIEIIFLLIIPIILIFVNGWIDFFGYALIVDEKNNMIINELLEEEFINCKNPKIIIVENKYKEDDIVKIVTNKLKVEEYMSNSESEFIKYMEENGIDIYDTWNKIRFIYILVAAILIFFRKLSENADMFGKFEERDN